MSQRGVKSSAGVGGDEGINGSRLVGIDQTRSDGVLQRIVAGEWQHKACDEQCHGDFCREKQWDGHVPAVAKAEAPNSIAELSPEITDEIELCSSEPEHSREERNDGDNVKCAGMPRHQGQQPFQDP